MAKKPKLIPNLTEQEQTLLRKAFVYGPSVFLSAGMHADAAKALLNRPEAQEFLLVLDMEFKTREAYQARTQYALTRDLSRMAEDAKDILAKAIRGKVFAKDASTGRTLYGDNDKPIVLDDAPTAQQVAAAQDVLNRLGVTERAEIRDVDTNIGQLLLQVEKAQITINYGDLKSEEQKALSREKVRVAIAILSKDLPKLLLDSSKAPKKVKAAHKPKDKT